MKDTNIIKRTSIPLAILTVQLFLFVSFSLGAPKNTYAIVCPDGSVLPDERADECPPATGNGSGSSADDGLSTAERCATVQPGTPEADGCTFFAPQLNDVVNTEGKYQCGKGNKTIRVGFNFGCRGADSPTNINPIVDLALAIFRFLTAGVGIVVIASVVVAGIQYTMSRGNPQSITAAISRVTNAVIALLLYIFMFAIANFIVPGGMFIT
jgi:hypothetical protein